METTNNQSGPEQGTTRRVVRRKLRYDRILALILIVILLLVLLVKCLSSCSNKRKAAREAAATTTAAQTTAPLETQPPTEPTTLVPDMSNTVFLSPSDETANTYYLGDTNEADECRLIAEKTAAILEQNGYDVVIAENSMSVQDRVLQANSSDYAAYVAIHSNQGTGVGASGYYNSAVVGSGALAKAVYDPVSELTINMDNGLFDAGATDSATYLYEIASTQIPACQIEMEYHDGPNVAQFILDNEDKLAAAIAGGITSFLSGGTSGGGAVTTTALGAGIGSPATQTTAYNGAAYNGYESSTVDNGGYALYDPTAPTQNAIEEQLSE